MSYTFGGVYPDVGQKPHTLSIAMPAEILNLVAAEAPTRVNGGRASPSMALSCQDAIGQRHPHLS